MDSRRGGRKSEAPMNARPLLDALARPRHGLPAALLFGGLASLARGVDTNWDLRNYHFYNPWAWLHGRLGFDYAPAQVQSFYSPLLDVPFFALVASGLPTYAITFLLGLPFGAGAWFFYRIARDAVGELGVEREGPVLAAVVLVALTGAAGFSQIGSTMNEWATAAFVLGALFALVRARRGGDVSPAAAAGVAGLLCGVATGLKPTAAIYAVALGCTLLACFRGRPGYARALLAFALSALGGLALTYGYWAFVLWERFGNPFFPYFNGLFRSEWWDPQSFFDAKFRPTSLAGWIGLPFGLAFRNRLASEADLRDPRLALLIAFGIVLAASVVRRARAAGESVAAAIRRSLPPPLRLLAVFAAAAYAAWIAVFTIYRYAIPLELVASLLLVLAMRATLAGFRRRDLWLGAAAVLVVAATIPPYWGRARLSAGPYFDVAMPAIAADSLVLLMTGEPFGYLVPFLPPGARAAAPASNFTGPWHHNRLQREMAALIAAQRGPIYAIRYLDATVAAEEATMAAYGLARNDAECRAIRSNREARPLGVCPLLRVR